MFKGGAKTERPSIPAFLGSEPGPVIASGDHGVAAETGAVIARAFGTGHVFHHTRCATPPRKGCEIRIMSLEHPYWKPRELEIGLVSPDLPKMSLMFPELPSPEPPELTPNSRRKEPKDQHHMWRPQEVYIP
jgi:hypothetical protein